MKEKQQTSSLFSNHSKRICLPESLRKLTSRIHNHFEKNNGTSQIMKDIAKTLQCFGNIGTIGVVKAILEDKALLSKIARSSYLHKNGFFKILLAKESCFSIRLHVWIPGAHAEETLHNHRWYLASTILTGALHSEIWQNTVCSGSQQYDEYIYTSKNENPIFLGKTRVSLQNKVIKHTGDAYVLNPDTLHRIISCQRLFTTTLMCRSFCVQDWARNVLVTHFPPDVKPHYLSPDDLKAVLEQYLNNAVPIASEAKDQKIRY